MRSSIALTPSANANASNLFAGVQAGFCQLDHDIVQRGQPYGFTDVFPHVDLGAVVLTAHEFSHRTAHIYTHALDHSVAFRMNRTGIQRVCPVPDAQETRRLLKGFGPESCDF